MIGKTFSMPDKLGEHIDHRVRTGGYGNDSELFANLSGRIAKSVRESQRSSKLSMRA